MGASFALGSIGFALAPLDVYLSRTGAHADAVTYFTGSILFTMGGLAQSWLALPERRAAAEGVAAWRAAWVQSVGTVLFNVMTFAGIHVSVTSAGYDTRVWLPNAIGSLCFLLSGAFFYVSAPRRGWRLERRHNGWWEPAVNGLGCVLFAVSAVAALPTSHGEMVSATMSDWTTTFGALCFLTVGLVPLRSGHSLKVPRLRLRRLEQVVERDAVEVGAVLEREL